MRHNYLLNKAANLSLHCWSRKMKTLVVVTALIVVAASEVAYSRPIRDDVGVSETMVTCEATYGFLPCSTSVWGLLFLVVVYEILLSIAAQSVTNGSNLFFQIIGPGVVGGSVFQILGTIPQLVVVLVPLLTGSEAHAQERASTGMALVLGGVVMLLTLVWGLTVILGSSQDDPDNDASQTLKTLPQNGSALVTDVETSWTARLILVASIPFLILEFQKFFTSQSARRVVILIALIVTVALLAAYIVYQSFQPWIQNRCFEYMMDRYSKDKLLTLITSNGRPDTRKIQQLFNKIEKDDNASVTAAEIRVLVVGVKMDDDDTSRNIDSSSITTYFDTSGDGGINRDEFIKGMTKLASSLLDQTPISQTTKVGNDISQVSSEEQQALLSSKTDTSQTASSNSWSIYLRAAFLVIFGIGVACALAEPLIASVIDFADAANMSSFCVSYIVLPLALNYDIILQSITPATQKAQKTNSLTLSSLYGSVFMNNMIGLMPFLAPVYFRNLTSDVTAELLVVLVISIAMGIFTSFNTRFPRWTGYVVLCLYPVSLVTVYLLSYL